MWLIFALISMVFITLVEYSDEYLTHSSTSKESKNIHERIGGVLMMSVGLTLIGIVVCFLSSETIFINTTAIYLALLSSIPMLICWIGYFYLFQKYSAHQVVPLFGLSSLWLLGIELSLGETIGIISLCGVVLLIISSYILDNGSLKWKSPSSLFVSMLFVSLSSALTGYLWRLAMDVQDASFAIYFWHLLGIFFMGFLLFLITPYRRGLIHRIKTEKTHFMGHCFFNETCVQISSYFSVLAFAAAPLATYVTASGGIQSIMLLALFYFFPLQQRNKISLIQMISIVGIGVGICLLEIF